MLQGSSALKANKHCEEKLRPGPLNCNVKVDQHYYNHISWLKKDSVSAMIMLEHYFSTHRAKIAPK